MISATRSRSRTTRLRLLPTSREARCLLDLKSEAKRPGGRTSPRRTNGNQTKRLAAFSERTGRKFHWLCADRSSVRPARTCPDVWRSCDLRTRCTYGVAYASAWPDLDRHLRMRLDPMLGRTQGGNPARRRLWSKKELLFVLISCSVCDRF